MFKCAELPYLVQFFLMFSNDKPVDWLLDYLVQTKSCNLDKNAVSLAVCYVSTPVYMFMVNPIPARFIFL